MRISDFFECDDREKWIEKIDCCDWGAAKFLARLLRENLFFETLGEKGQLFMMTEGDNIVSFATLTKVDCIDDDSLYPWIGFVYTHPDYRGQRRSGEVIDCACRSAKQQGYDKVYLATDHVGFYEKYGFEYMETRIDIYKEESRIYFKEL